MNIVVCCKAVPGLVTDLKIAADGKAIQYQGQLLAINECDEYALEEALALKRTHGGQVTAISMGNIKALDILYYALAKGADKAVRVDFESQDPRVASTVIAAALGKLDFDLVLTGTQSRDTLAVKWVSLPPPCSTFHSLTPSWKSSARTIPSRYAKNWAVDVLPRWN